MHWPDFATRLGTALNRLATLPDMDATLVICQSTRPLAYVQFLVNEGGVYAEVSSGSKYLPKDERLSKESFAVLQGAGWRLRERRGNWMAEAETTGCADLADKCVVALRDVWVVPDPDALGYRAFQAGTTDDLPLPELGLRQDPNQ